MQKRAFIALLTVATFAAQQGLAAHSAQMQVSVEVIARTLFTLDSQPVSVTVSAADIARGYVDVPSAVAFHVRSNARNGYAIEFQPVSGPFTQAQVTWGTNTANVGTDGSWLAQPYQSGTTFATMSVRLAVAPGTAPGTYAWPVSISANSL